MSKRFGSAAHPRETRTVRDNQFIGYCRRVTRDITTDTATLRQTKLQYEGTMPIPNNWCVFFFMCRVRRADFDVPNTYHLESKKNSDTVSVVHWLPKLNMQYCTLVKQV